MAKKKIGFEKESNEFPKYKFPDEVFQIIRTLVPGDIKVKILENVFPVSLNDFCDALEIRNKIDFYYSKPATVKLYTNLNMSAL